MFVSFWIFSVGPKHMYLCICVLSTSGLGQSVLNLCILGCVCVYPEPKRDPASMTEDDSLIYGKAISRMTTATECVCICAWVWEENATEREKEKWQDGKEGSRSERGERWRWREEKGDARRREISWAQRRIDGERMIGKEKERGQKGLTVIGRGAPSYLARYPKYKNYMH